MSHCAIRRCSRSCHGVCGAPLGFLPRSSTGNPAMASSKLRCAPSMRSRFTSCLRRGSRSAISPVCHREPGRKRCRMAVRQMQTESQIIQQPGISRWWRVVGGLSMNLALGTLYAWSVFVAPLEKQFGWKRAETSMVFTIAVMVFALSFVVAGRIQDKIGPFYCSLAGGLLVSLGFFLCSYTTSLTYLFVCFGVIGGLGNGFGYATPIPVMAKWFPDKRGLAVGLAVGGYGAGSAIFGPLSQLKLIPTYGLPTTFKILGAIFLVMTLVGAFLLKNPPAGYRPDGWSPAAAKSAAGARDFTPD